MELGLLAPGRENLCGGGVHPARGSHLSSLRLCLSYLALSLLYVFSCIKYFLLTFKSLTVMSNSCNPMDCSLPCCSVHGILQARVLEWVAISFCFHFLTLRLFVCFGSLGFPRGASGKDLTCQCRRHNKWGFSPLVGNIPWKRKWQPTPIFLPG